jgi:hypothetical protein
VEQRVRSRGLGGVGQLERLAGRVAAGARDDRHPLARGLDDRRDHRDVLLDRERRRLAGRADRDQAVDTLLDLPVDQPGQPLEVDLAVAERGHERGETAFDRRELRHGVLWSLDGEFIATTSADGMPFQGRAYDS